MFSKFWSSGRALGQTEIQNVLQTITFPSQGRVHGLKKRIGSMNINLGNEVMQIHEFITRRSRKSSSVYHGHWVIWAGGWDKNLKVCLSIHVCS